MEELTLITEGKVYEPGYSNPGQGEAWEKITEYKGYRIKEYHYSDGTIDWWVTDPSEKLVGIYFSLDEAREAIDTESKNHMSNPGEISVGQNVKIIGPRGSNVIGMKGMVIEDRQHPYGPTYGMVYLVSLERPAPTGYTEIWFHPSSLEVIK